MSEPLDSHIACPHCGMPESPSVPGAWQCGTTVALVGYPSTACREISKRGEWIDVLERALAKHAGAAVLERVQAWLTGKEGLPND